MLELQILSDEEAAQEGVYNYYDSDLESNRPEGKMIAKGAMWCHVVSWGVVGCRGVSWGVMEMLILFSYYSCRI